MRLVRRPRVWLALAGVLLAFGMAGPVAMPRHLMAAFALLALGADVLIGLAWSRWVRVAAVGAVLLTAVPVSLERTTQRATSVEACRRLSTAPTKPSSSGNSRPSSPIRSTA